MQQLLRTVDHLVLAVPDLHQAIAEVHELTGVKPKIGGQHMGRGTWNALLALGHDTYLELIAPDPQQVLPEKGCWMGVDQIKEPKLIHWAAKVHPIVDVIKKAKNHQVQIGKLSSSSRTRINGQVLSWMLTEPVSGEDGGLLPFLIDWEDSDHPAESLPQKCKLIHLEGRHPHPEQINAQLAVLDIQMEISLGNRPQLLASINTPNGVVSFF
ncbi:MAG TPA: VOC family protein [Saprospiraceae bacterium]|nr:VOC family protein [Saprospiraceae bacterium]